VTKGKVVRGGIKRKRRKERMVEKKGKGSKKDIE
jgi:hypothetical protein